MSIAAQSVHPRIVSDSVLEAHGVVLIGFDEPLGSVEQQDGVGIMFGAVARMNLGFRPPRRGDAEFLRQWRKAERQEAVNIPAIERRDKWGPTIIVPHESDLEAGLPPRISAVIGDQVFLILRDNAFPSMPNVCFAFRTRGQTVEAAGSI